MSRLERLAPLSAFLVLIFVAAGFIILGETPSLGDSPQKVADFYKDNDTEAFISSALVSLGAVMLVWFGGSLRAHIRPKEGGEGRTASLVFAATIVMGVGMTIFAGIEATAADAADDLPAGAIQTINAFDNDMFFTLAAGVVMLYLALAIAILRFGAFPKWLGWVAALFAVASLTPAGFFVFLLSGIYLPVLGVVIYRAQDGGAGPAAPAPVSPA
jgi:hypothetical protein